MKKTVRILSALLACVMLAACLPAATFAKESEKPYDRVIFFGDSNSRGKGLDDQAFFNQANAGRAAEGAYYTYSGYSIHGQESQPEDGKYSYTDLISEALVNEVEVTDEALGQVAYVPGETTEGFEGQEKTEVTKAEKELLVKNSNRFAVTYQGETLSSILGLLGMADENDDELLSDIHTFGADYYKKMQYYFGDVVSDRVSQELGGATEGLYPLSKLIAGDGFEAKTGRTYYTGFNMDGMEYYGQTITNPAIAGVEQDKVLVVITLGTSELFYRSNEVGANGDFNKIISDTDTMKKYISALYEGYNYVSNNYGRLIEKIQALNPEADIVVVGTYNIFADLTINDEILLPIGDVFSTVTGLMNHRLSEIAKEHGCAFADISNLETPAQENDYSIMSDDYMSDRDMNIHPSLQNGTRFMANQVVASLEGYTPSTNIKVDLARYHEGEILSVMVDKRTVRNYSMNGTVLTVPNFGKNATLLTVYTKSNGILGVQSYQLVFKDGHYVPYKIGSINNVSKSAQKVSNVVSSLTGKLSGLFSR